MKLSFSGCLLASHLLAASLHAQIFTDSWVNPGAGNWFSAGNWSNGVPTSLYFAYVNNGGTALLTTPGASVRGLFIGDLLGNGELRISGGGVLSAQEGIDVGVDHNGRMTLSGGGRAFSQRGDVGFTSGGNGIVTVTDPGSRWSLTDYLSVGGQGTGTLDILNGGVVSSSRYALIGEEGSAAVRVRDSGSFLSLVDSLSVGGSGSGYLEVGNGGLVSSASGSIGGGGNPPPFGPSSSALVTGAGSRWNTGSLFIGSTSGQRASLRIENGGTVQTTDLALYASGTLELGANPTLTGPLTFLGGVVRTFATVSLNNAVNLASGSTVQMINYAGGATLNGVISGSGGLTKAGLPGVGEGPLTLTANNTYTGATIVDQGALLVRGRIVSATTVNDGGTLAGTGAVAAPVQVNSGGALEPGILDSGFGTLTASSVSFGSGGIFRWDFHSGIGAADRLVLSTGGLSLNANAVLTPRDLGNTTLSAAQTFTLIEKQSAGFASGNFAGYSEGACFNLGANRFAISYRGGDGNDVTLTTIVPLVWNSGGTSDHWSDAANWSANIAPVNGDSLIFGSGARVHPVMDSAALGVEEVTFVAGAPAFTIHVPEGASQPQLTINNSLTNSGTLAQTFVADGATAAGMNGGVLTINSNSMSGPITLIARGPTGAGPNGGVIQLFGAADGVAARVITEPGTYFEFGARGSDLRLGSIEGGGQILMGSNSLLVGYNNLDTEFSGTLAGDATARLEKHGAGRLILSESNTYGGGTTVHAGTLEVRAPINQLGLGDVTLQPGGAMIFSQTASADFQTVTLRGSSSAGQLGGTLRFQDTANAGRLTLVVEGATAGFAGGRVIFEEDASAGTSTNFTVKAGIGTQGVSGGVVFTGNATATGAALLTNRGGTSTGAQGGLTTFRENASAGAATIVNEGGPATFGGSALFVGSSSAGTSHIINQGVAGIGTGPLFLLRKGRAVFGETSTAGAATIDNLASPATTGLGGVTYFTENAVAGLAQITNEGSSSGGSGYVEFSGTASAGSATITNRGALAPAGSGGVTRIWDDATAGSATLLAKSGIVAGAAGGAIFFEARGKGGVAAVTVEAGARFDISRLTTPSLSIGSIAGAGTFFLGSKELVTGGNNADTIITGTISDGGQDGGVGASLTKTGTGALTLAGLNSYTGKTTVNAGTLNLDSALLDAAIDVTGGVLNVSGDVTGAAIHVGGFVPATANFHASQTLDALTIGDFGVVVLGGSPPPAPGALAVPEPGIGALLLSAFALLGARRSIRGARASRVPVSASRRIELPDAPDPDDAPAFRTAQKVRAGGTPSPARETRALRAPPLKIYTMKTRSTRRPKSRATAMLCGALATLLPLTAAATNYTWTGAGANNNVSNAANWSGGTPFSDLNFTFLIFPSASDPAPIFDTSNFAMAGMQFNIGASAYIIPLANPITVGSSGIVSVSANNQRIDTPINLGTANSVISAANGALAFTGLVNLGASALGVSGSGNTSFINLGGTGTVTKSGIGTLTWSPTSVQSADFVVNAGTLVAGGVSVITLDAGASVTVNGSASFNVDTSTILTGGAQLTVANTAFATLASGRSFRAESGSDVAGGFNLITSGGRVTVTGAGSTFTLPGLGRLNGGSTLTVQDGGVANFGSYLDMARIRHRARWSSMAPARASPPGSARRVIGATARPRP